jgi:hypothetical protein
MHELWNADWLFVNPFRRVNQNDMLVNMQIPHRFFDEGFLLTL